MQQHFVSIGQAFLEHPPLRVYDEVSEILRVKIGCLLQQPKVTPAQDDNRVGRCAGVGGRSIPPIVDDRIAVWDGLSVYLADLSGDNKAAKGTVIGL